MNIETGVTILCIKDIMQVTGKSMRTAQRMHTNIKKKCNKHRADFVTIDEFCACTGFTVERVWRILK